MSSDSFGNRYSKDYDVFLRASASIKTITIKRECVFIDGSSETDNAFFDCSSTLESVLFEPGSLLEAIRPFSFHNCTQILSLDFSLCNKLTSIGTKAFYNCKKVTSLILPPNLISIGHQSFSNIRISTVVFPSSLQKLNGYSFGGAKLVNYSFQPNPKITTITDGVFEYCSNLKTIYIPKSVSSFCGLAVYATYNIKEIVLEEGNPWYNLIDGVLYSKDNKTLVYYPSNRNPVFTVPSFVNTLAYYSLAASYFTNITLSNSITTISSAAFRFSELTSIVIPSSVTIMYSHVFGYCSQLNSIKFEGIVTIFDAWLFSYSGFTSFDVPDGVQSINAMCFYSCSKLENVTLPSSLSSVGGGAFSLCHKNLNLVFRNASNLVIDSQLMILDTANKIISSYIGSEPDAIIEIPVSVEIIKTYAFSSKANIIGFSIPADSKIYEIGSHAFENCYNIVSFPFLPSLKTIREYAFQGCSRLQSFSLGSFIRLLMEYSFSGCISLENVTMLPCDSLLLNDFVFKKCTNLKNIIFCEGLSSIGKSSFIECESINALSFPSTIGFIGENAFEGSGLREVYFAENCILEELQSYSFYKCQSLSNITLPQIRCICKYSLSCTSICHFVLPRSVETLEDSCFKECSQLISFSIPKDSSLINIGFGIFVGCTKFQQISSFPNNNFTVQNEALFNRAQTELIVLPPLSNIRFFYFPSSITIVKQCSFNGCSLLENVFIPDQSIHTIEACAFENCERLQFINLPSSVTQVGVDVFKGCKMLKCGVLIENRNTTFLSMLTEIGKLPVSCLKSCLQYNTCRRASNRHVSFHFISAFVFISTK